jgi:hypothetical protein
MATSNESAQIPVGEFRRTAALLGFLVKAEVDAIFKQQPFKTADGEGPLDLWRKLDQSRSNLSAVPSGQITALPESLTDAERAVRQRKTYKQYYEGVADYSFGSARLILCQSIRSPWKGTIKRSRCPAIKHGRRRSNTARIGSSLTSTFVSPDSTLI